MYVCVCERERERDMKLPFQKIDRIPSKCGCFIEFILTRLNFAL
jgi:hypothetical protein